MVHYLREARQRSFLNAFGLVVRPRQIVLTHLKVVRCAQQRRLILVSQRLFGKGQNSWSSWSLPSGSPPCCQNWSPNDMHVVNFCHLFSPENPPGTAVTGRAVDWSFGEG
jgi:hypothetical protein